jgi:mRNA interferase RelE/StbE
LKYGNGRKKIFHPFPRKADAQNIVNAIFALEDGLAGDIKKLTNFSPEYRLRVGNWRILFELSKNKIIIYRIINRKEAYR